jgi:ankyrin repeat protein
MSTLDNLRKTAKRWLKAIRANDTDAQTRLRRAYPGAPPNPTLRDVQYALAREQGYESWADLRRTIDQGVSPTKGMIQPIEMQRTLPMTLHGGVVSTTTRVWEMLCASRDGDLDRVMQLVSEQPQLSTCQYNYTPPLHFAVREGHLPVVRALVDQKAFDPSYKSYPFGDSFLTMAEDRGYDEIVLLLREALSNPALTRKWRETGNIDYGQDEGQKHFDDALHEEKFDEVERLLTDRPELARNEMSSWAEGVLMMSSRGGNRPMLELLIRFGATVPNLSKWGRFYYFKHDDIAAFLLQNGMNPGHMTWHRVTLLHDMAQSGDITKARLLLDHGANINAIDDEYRSTPLGMAARWGQKDMVAFLLERGADPNRAGATWATPLAWARKKGHPDVADDLIASGATS